MAKTRGVSFKKMEQTILAAAGDLFDLQGYNQTSLQQIADALGMARPSLYHYFDNREQILVAGVERLTEHRNVITEELRNVEGDPIEKLTALMLGLGTLLSDNPVWVRILLHDGVALPDDVRAQDLASRISFFELLVETLRNGIELGYVRAHDERATAMTIVSSLTGLQAQFAAPIDVSHGDLMRMTVDIILYGILERDRREGTPLERGLQLIREGTELVERGARWTAQVASAAAGPSVDPAPEDSEGCRFAHL
jgi:AcrR family transcriptional regulator